MVYAKKGLTKESPSLKLSHDSQDLYREILIPLRCSQALPLIQCHLFPLSPYNPHFSHAGRLSALHYAKLILNTEPLCSAFSHPELILPLLLKLLPHSDLR